MRGTKKPLVTMRCQGVARLRWECRDGALADYEEVLPHAIDCRFSPRRVSTLRDADPASWDTPPHFVGSLAEMPTHFAGPMVVIVRATTTPRSANWAWDDAGVSATRPARLVFRLPTVALVMPAVLLFCVVPLGATGGWRLLMFLIPLAGLVWVVITRTTADAAGLRVSGLATRRSLSWAQIGRVELDGGRWVVVTDRAGRRTRLPMVLPGDLPRLVEVSGGAFDPAAPA